MCHADSLLHPCGHSSTQWTYCRESRLSGKGTAPPECDDRTWGNSIVSNEHCPLAYCNFKPGSSWTCCACGGSGNWEGWCLHDRGRWERDSYTGWANWVDKCEHNCCTNCTRDFQDETVVLQHAKSAAAQKSGKSSGLKKGTRKTKKASGPEDVPLPSIEADDREHHDADGSKKKSKSSKPSTTTKRKK